ncbi:cytochrome P450 [Punctularia strigosozonata HHB-11173 SS5]|uniref:cytochrome P450 n=1 Tax=Punctularia strigosozonata (strain HHB-11173) TaxID=741275 RepID=UPI0004417652|nr:cytochrome P450 [Punctularia strigosozonata HHB-11173 SS5]EIN05560.1 cytochrome P450 [Punctularia strigosozonata HHB-11173 SS5]
MPSFELTALPASAVIPLTGTCLYLGWQYLRRRLANPHGLPLPPGPSRRIPWVGNASDMPTGHPWLKYDEWTKEYGDVVYLESFGQGIVILGSLEACVDIFDRRSSNFSDRMGWGWILSTMNYGERWRKRRRAFHQFFNVNQVHQYRPIQLREARALLPRLLESPERFAHHLRHTLSAVIMDVTYGIKIADTNDKYITKAEEAISRFAHAGNPTTYLVNTFPWLKHVPAWFPGAQFKRDAIKWRPLSHEMVTWPFEDTKDLMRQGTAKPCILTALLDRITDEEDRAEAELIVRDVTGVAYADRVGKTISATQTFFLAMVMYPEVQKKAQEELDAITRGTRLPDFDDLGSLPYVSALCKEVMRWQPVVPLAVVHTSVEDDEYRGYHLPKGTLFFGNAWSILHDPKEYPDPEVFKPERFLKDDGTLNPAVRDPGVAAFGFGRRICPGRWMSDQTLFSVVATVLAVYSIAPPLDMDGKAIKLFPDMTPGMLSYPRPFECIISPRSTQSLKLIQEVEGETY